MMPSQMIMFRCLTVLCFVFLLTGCSSIAKFDQQAYNNAVNTKVSALILIDKAMTPYQQNQTEIAALRYALTQGYEYAKGIPQNEITTQQWVIMKNPEGHLMGGFLERWQAKQILKPAFIENVKSLVGAGFDTIIGLESGKIKPADIKKE